MEAVKLTLKDGKEYTFSDVEIGYFRRFRAAAFKADAAAIESIGLEIIARSLEQLHPEVTIDLVENKLITPITFDDVLQAAMRASGTGEMKPAAIH